MKPLVFEVGEALIARGLTVSSAESCTGGMVASALTQVPGISAVFFEGYVTYANEAKEKNLGVSHETLERFGAVSHECAKEMAEGVRARSGADLGVATTGIAGPGGGTKEKPVGTVFIAVATEETTAVERLSLSGDREKIRKETVQKLLELVARTAL